MERQWQEYLLQHLYVLLKLVCYCQVKHDSLFKQELIKSNS